MEWIDRLDDESLVCEDSLQLLVLLDQQINDGIQLSNLGVCAFDEVVQSLIERVIVRKREAFHLLDGRLDLVKLILENNWVDL